MRLRRTLACYMRGPNATHDRQSVSSDASADDHDQWSDHHSLRVVRNQQPPLESTNSTHHEEQARPLAMSSQQPTTSNITHDHEQAGPLTMSSPHDEQPAVDPDQHEAPVPDKQARDDQHVFELIEAAPFTEQASTSNTIDGVQPVNQ